MGKEAKNKQLRRQSSGFKDHQQIGKKLHPPLTQIPVKPAQWSIDMLPEMLLIDAVVNELTWKYAPNMLHKVFDILDQFVPQDSRSILTGSISSLSLIPEEARADARAALAETRLLTALLPDGLFHGLALYPDCPARWLLSDWQKNSTANWERGVSYLKDAVGRLRISKSVYATRCRMISVARMMKHGKIAFPNVPEIIEVLDLFPQYPEQLTEDEQLQVEATSRSFFLALYNIEQDGKVQEWVPYFWRHNYDISMCEQMNEEEKRFVEAKQLQRVTKAMNALVERFTLLCQRTTKRAKLDLYDVDRDEVIFGLLGRQYRLFKALAMNTSFWTADLGTMFHRVMVDTLITLKWLTHQSDASLFYQYKQFSLGKQKLLQLHVQELVDEGREDLKQFEEDLLDEINEEIWEALLSIDLGGNFAGMDMRKMAHEVDLREKYNLVYSPASAELHGEWTSLKKFNLVRCSNPLHRFHRLPQFSSEHFLFPQAVLLAGSILVDTFTVWLDAYHLQEFAEESKNFVSELNAVFTQLDEEEVI